jgi:hypothetical protein
MSLLERSKEKSHGTSAAIRRGLTSVPLYAIEEVIRQKGKMMRTTLEVPQGAFRGNGDSNDGHNVSMCARETQQEFAGAACQPSRYDTMPPLIFVKVRTRCRSLIRVSWVDHIWYSAPTHCFRTVTMAHF